MNEPVENISFRPWESPLPPRRVLIIRMHAVGDVAITFPVCMALREKFPDCQIDFLTTHSVASLVEALDIFNQVYRPVGPEKRWRRLYNTLWWSYRLRRQSYDIVLDLQGNWVSRALRLACAPDAWSEFDRFSPRPAGTRSLETVQRLGFADLRPCYRMRVRRELVMAAGKLLGDHGWDGRKRLVVLNPAGWWETRNWPLQNYVDLASLWLKVEDVQFLLLGTERIRPKAASIQGPLKNAVVNLVGKTSLGEALAVLQNVSLAISEDSGLMHMAWVSGVPTLALFGSSRYDWSIPLGEHSRCLHSGDLPCGACMSPTCRYGDVHCLTRYSPQSVFAVGQELLAALKQRASKG